MKQQVTTGDTKSAHILSQGIVSNGLIFLSGQVHCNSELELVGDTTEEKVAPFPVREAVCVQALPLGASIEISVIAAKG